MADRLPVSLASLLQASPAERDGAWTAFLEKYSERILKTARSLGGDEDAVMDRYLFVVEELVRDDFRRLRAYAPDARARFSTWLAIVVRRLCLDHHRARYGRAPSEGTNPRTDPGTRRRLVDLVGSELELSCLPTASAARPDRQLEREERLAALQATLEARTPEELLLLTLRFEEELTAREIARLLHLPSPFHVYRRLKRLLADLRRQLARRGITR